MQNSRKRRVGEVRTDTPVDIVSLYQQAEDYEIPVYWYSMDTAMESLVVRLPDGSCAIALDPLKIGSLGEEKYKLAHELGHGVTGALYCRDTPLDERGRNELRADRWAIAQLLPFPALEAAVLGGRTAPAELAEYFELPQSVVEKAIAYYTGPCGLTFGSKDNQP